MLEIFLWASTILFWLLMGIVTFRLIRKSKRGVRGTIINEKETYPESVVAVLRNAKTGQKTTITNKRNGA